MWWSRTSLGQGLWHNNCLCYFWGSRVLTNKCCTRRSCRFCQNFNKWRLITTRSTNHMCWVANNWSITNLLLWFRPYCKFSYCCKTSVANAKEHWVFADDSCFIWACKKAIWQVQYNSYEWKTSHTNVQLWLSSSLSSWYGTLFLSGQRSATERTFACSRTDENMAVWHAAILSKIDNQ